MTSSLAQEQQQVFHYQWITILYIVIQLKQKGVCVPHSRHVVTFQYVCSIFDYFIVIYIFMYMHVFIVQKIQGSQSFPSFSLIESEISCQFTDVNDNINKTSIIPKSHFKIRYMATTPPPL